MKINKLLAFALGLAVVGCTNDLADDGIIGNNDAVLSNAEPVEVIIEATIAGEEQTKVNTEVDYIEGTTKKSYVLTTFEEGDAIGVFFNNETAKLTHENVKFTVDEINKDADGNITSVIYKTTEPMILLGAGNNTYAYFPYEATDATIEATAPTRANTFLGAWDGQHQFEIPSVQIQRDLIKGGEVKDAAYYDKVLLSDYVNLFAPQSKIEKDGNAMKVTMAFEHAFSYITLNVTSDFAKDVAIKGADIYLYNAGEPVNLAGTYSLNLDTKAITAVTPAAGKLTVNAENQAAGFPFANGNQTFITAAVAPVAAFDSYIVDIRTTDGFMFRIKKSFDRTYNIPRAVNQQFGIVLDNKNRYDNDFFHIYDAATLRQYIENSANKGATIYIDEDIDMAADYVANGPVVSKLDGVWTDGNGEECLYAFDTHKIIGGDHTISNLVIEGEERAGFLSSSVDCEISNLTFKNAKVTANSSNGNARGYAGVVVAQSYGCKMSGVKVVGGEVNGINKVGGLIGFAAQGSEVQIANCSVEDTTINAGALDANATNKPGYAGGVIGFTQESLTYINNTTATNVTVNVTDAAEGRPNGLFVGTFHSWDGSADNTLRIENCSATGTLNEDDVTTYSPYSVKDQATYIPAVSGTYDFEYVFNALVGGNYDNAGTVQIGDITFYGIAPAIVNDAYQVWNRTNLAYLMENYSENNLEANVAICSHIDMSGYAAKSLKPRKGNATELNGDSKVLMNLNYTYDDTKSGSHGFFSATQAQPLSANNVKIYNMNIQPANFDNKGDINNYAGAIVGSVCDVPATIKNITIYNSNIYGSVKVGGLVGVVMNDSKGALYLDKASINNTNICAIHGQVGGVVGYLGASGKGRTEGSYIKNVTTKTVSVKGGYMQSGRTMGAIVGTLGLATDQGVAAPYIDDFTVANTGVTLAAWDKGSNSTAAEAQLNNWKKDSFMQIVGGWDDKADVTTDDVVDIAGRLFHARAYNVYDAETMKAAFENATIDRPIYIIDAVDFNNNTVAAITGTSTGEIFIAGNEAPYKQAVLNKVNLTDGLINLNTTDDVDVTVKNLTFNTVAATGAAKAGVVAAQLITKGEATIDNVDINDATVTAPQAGGLVGYLQAAKATVANNDIDGVTIDGDTKWTKYNATSTGKFSGYMIGTIGAGEYALNANTVANAAGDPVLSPFGSAHSNIADCIEGNHAADFNYFGDSKIRGSLNHYTDSDISKITVDGNALTAYAYYVADNEDIEQVLNNTGSDNDPLTIVLLENDYTMPVVGNSRKINFYGYSKSNSVIIKNKGNNYGDYTATLNFEHLTVLEKGESKSYGGNLVAKETYTDCNVVGTLVTYAPEVEVIDCTFTPNTEFEYYNVHIYAAGKATFKNTSFTTKAARSIYAHAESAKKMDITFDNCSFSSIDQLDAFDSRWHQAIRIHTELGIYGSLTINNCTTDGKFNPAYNDGLWVEWNNGTKALTNNFTKTINGVVLPAYIGNDEAAESLLDLNLDHIVIDMTADLTLDLNAWETLAWGGADTKTITINGNGHTLTFNHLNSDWNNIAAGGAKLIINNAKLTNTGHNNGPWNRHDLNFACEVELNDCTSDKAIALKNNATLKNVTINDANTSDTYGMWIQPNGQTVNIDGLTLDMLACTDGRGIKIDDQYVDFPGRVTLNVANSTFKTEEKAAIIVKNGAAGAEINLSNVDIAEVAADAVNAVWVDSDASLYADRVNVTGGTKIVEPGTAAATTVQAATADAVIAALNDDTVAVVEMTADVKIDTPTQSNGYAKTGLVVDGQVFDGGGNTLSVPGATSTWSSAATVTTGGLIKNLTVDEGFRGIFINKCSGEVTLSNVVIDGPTYTISCDSSNNGNLKAYNSTFNGWTSYAATIGVVYFEDCNFGEGAGYSYCRPYAPTTFRNCAFEAGYVIDARAAIVLENCTFGGVAVTAANLAELVPYNTGNATVK